MRWLLPHVFYKESSENQRKILKVSQLVQFWEWQLLEMVSKPLVSLLHVTSLGKNCYK